jgi:ApaG protein
MFTRTTQLIKVTVLPLFLPDQSSPEDDYYVWAYTVSIENLSQRTVQLMSRTWKITDAHGQVQYVQGAGVVGEQPVLEVGFSYQYSSGTVLHTSSGIMEGSYDMLDVATGDMLSITIPIFSLDSPQERSRPN